MATVPYTPINADTAVQVEEQIEASSPWTRDKLKYLDEKDWGDKSVTWNTAFVEGLNGFEGLTIAVRNLQPFAKIRRNNTLFYVDAFSIDAGQRGFKPLSSYSPDTHEAHHGDLIAWEKADEVNLLNDIHNSCERYTLVLHRAVVIDELYIVELARVANSVAAEPPTVDLDIGLSGVLDEEADSIEYVEVRVTLKFVIHRSLNDQDMWGEDMKGSYGSMSTLNELLNRGEVPGENGENNFDWLMAAKVLQRKRRDGRSRWAVTIGRAFGARQQARIARERVSYSRELRTVASRVVADIVVRDGHRLLGGIGGVVTTVLGATRSDIGVIAAGITLIASMLSAGAKRGRGERSATRELVLGSGSTFDEEGGTYGKVVERGGDIATPLELGILECVGYKFRRDVAGNIMCVTKWGDIRACVVVKGKMKMDRRGRTAEKLLKEEVILPRRLIVG